ncbi:MAG TPA: hypothetical protein VFH51_12225 [Myxococcota bacterium]|nr:hypothetical protein [Myxococcota bacterium]
MASSNSIHGSSSRSPRAMTPEGERRVRNPRHDSPSPHGREGRPPEQQGGANTDYYGYDFDGPAGHEIALPGGLQGGLQTPPSPVPAPPRPPPPLLNVSAHGGNDVRHENAELNLHGGNLVNVVQPGLDKAARQDARWRAKDAAQELRASRKEAAKRTSAQEAQGEKSLKGAIDATLKAAQSELRPQRGFGRREGKALGLFTGWATSGTVAITTAATLTTGLTLGAIAAPYAAIPLTVGLFVVGLLGAFAARTAARFRQNDAIKAAHDRFRGIEARLDVSAGPHQANTVDENAYLAAHGKEALLHEVAKAKSELGTRREGWRAGREDFYKALKDATKGLLWPFTVTKSFLSSVGSKK